jgi:uncharacterized membrane protein YebE (DUF533 family)
MNVERMLGSLLGMSMGGQPRRNSRSSMGLPSGMKMQAGLGLLGVAMAAFEHFKQAPAAPTNVPVIPPPPPRGKAANVALPPPVPVPMPEDTQRLHDAQHLILAMVAAASADGVIDTKERADIVAKIAAAGVDDEAQAFLRGALDAPPSQEWIINATRPDIRREVYAASRVALTLDTPAEQGYLETLCARLDVSPLQRLDIDRQLGLT